MMFDVCHLVQYSFVHQCQWENHDQRRQADVVVICALSQDAFSQFLDYDALGIQLVLIFEFMQPFGQGDGCSCCDCVPDILPQPFLETQVLKMLVLMVQDEQP